MFRAGSRTIAATVCIAMLTSVGCVPNATRQRPQNRAVATSAPATRAPEGTGPADGARGVTHVVERGETLWRIARTYEVEMDELARINRIDDPTEIPTGLRLFVPGAEFVRAVPPVASSNVALSGTTDWLWPVRNGSLLSGFGESRRTHRHQGIDIRGTHGQPVLASRAGRVVYSGSGMRDYGKTVILDHGDGTSSLYAHNSSLAVRVGQQVRRGERIARVGRSGNASTDHCHLEIRDGNRTVDPMLVLDSGGETRR